MNDHSSKGTLYARDPDGGFVVLADGVDITYACVVDHATKRITLPDNLPDGAAVACTVPGYALANALHRETNRERKYREEQEARHRAAMRAAQKAEPVEEKEDATWAIDILTFCIWRALYGPGNPSPFPVTAGPYYQEATCSS